MSGLNYHGPCYRKYFWGWHLPVPLVWLVPKFVQTSATFYISVARRRRRVPQCPALCYPRCHISLSSPAPPPPLPRPLLSALSHLSVPGLAFWAVAWDWVISKHFPPPFSFNPRSGRGHIYGSSIQTRVIKFSICNGTNCCN